MRLSTPTALFSLLSTLRLFTCSAFVALSSVLISLRSANNIVQFGGSLALTASGISKSMVALTPGDKGVDVGAGVTTFALLVLYPRLVTTLLPFAAPLERVPVTDVVGALVGIPHCC
jgi:hypothetical protein